MKKAPRVIFIGNNKQASLGAFRYLLHKKIEVVAVVPPPSHRPNFSGQTLNQIAAAKKIPVWTEEELYEKAGSLKNVDWVISFLFWNRIRKPVIALGKSGCINFHPAPLPECRGVCGINFAIFEQRKDWGVSAHFVDETFDTGDLIATRSFKIDPAAETAFSLEHRSLSEMLELFKTLADKIVAGKPLPRAAQKGGRYISRKDFDAMKVIRPEDSSETIERKVRACWYPPYAGASFEIQGRLFTLVTEDLLKEIAPFYHAKPVARS